MLEAEAPVTNMNCLECGQQKGVIHCLDCSASPLFCRSCCHTAHKRFRTPHIQCWNSKYFWTSALWETGLVCNLGHGGLPCLGLSLAEEEDNRSQDAEWERHLNSGPMGPSVSPAPSGERCTLLPGQQLPPDSMTEGSVLPGCDAAEIEDFIALPDLDLCMNAAAQDVFEDEYVALDHDDSYNSDGIDGMEDHKVPDGDMGNNNDNRDDLFAQKNYEWTHGIMTPPHPNPEDTLGNPFVTFIEINGVHHLPLHYCICTSAKPHDQQLFAAKLFPSSFLSIKTAFTFNVLDDFQMTNLSCKISCYQYHLKLWWLTSPAFPNSVPNQYHELLRVSWQWRNLELRKSFGFGHHDNPPQTGEIGHGCASCPQPGINLLDNWKSNPNQWVTQNINKLKELIILITKREVFTRFICVDGNLSADHLKQRNPLDDILLMNGQGMMTNQTQYKMYLAHPVVIPQVSCLSCCQGATW